MGAFSLKNVLGALRFHRSLARYTLKEEICLAIEGYEAAYLLTLTPHAWAGIIVVILSVCVCVTAVAATPFTLRLLLYNLWYRQKALKKSRFP